MSIEILPLGQKCNLSCKNYCYETPMRDAGNEGGKEYDLDAITHAAEQAGVGKQDGRGNVTGWTGFGGEFLLTPLSDIEKLCEWSSKLHAPIGLQTNGTLITARHVELFKKYNVSIGVSMDGPEELNDERTSKADTLESTRKMTALSQKNIEWLLAEKIPTSLIVVVHNTNAGTDERLGKLIAWILRLRDLGLRHVNLHLLEPHGPESLSMSQERQTAAFRRLRKELKGLQVSPFSDMTSKLLQSGNSHCTFNFCSQQSTPAVTAINGQGEAARCGRMNNDGVSYERSSTHSYERYLALYHTPQKYGGCNGCRFFTSCGGHCPGEGEGGDWRNRTVHCQTLMAIFEDLEAELAAEGKDPISMSARRPALEAQLLGQWMGQTVSPVANVEHGDKPHGDRAHGDHTDGATVGQ